MKKSLIIALLPVLAFVSCKKDLTSLNENPKAPQTVTAASLFTNAQHTLSDVLASSNVNLNIFRLVDQYWQETTYTDESNYDINTRPIPQALWNTLYRDVLEDFETSKKLVDQTQSAEVQQNQKTVADIL